MSHDNITIPNHFDDLESIPSIPSIPSCDSVSNLSNSQQATRENSQEAIYNGNDSIDESLDNDTSLSEKDVNCSFFEKSNEEVRTRYISKLANMKLINMKPKKKLQNIFVFDWDDTLYCTSYFGNRPLTTLPAQCRAAVLALDAVVSHLLLKAVWYGDVFIITNSERGWVEASAREALPKTYQVILQKNIQVISARNEYENMFPYDMYRWKLEAFLSLQRKFDKDVMTNLVALGDSELEIRAANVLSQKFNESIIKTVKLKEHPRIDELIRQQKAILDLFDKIFLSWKSFTIEMGRNSRC